MNNLVLCGFKKSGKTTLGKEIAQKWGWAFIDTDDRISCNCRSFYVQFGPQLFRQREKEVILSLRDVKNTVIATGGGTFLDIANTTLLKKLGKIVYLHLEKEELRRRILIPPLPAFISHDDPYKSFEKMYEDRLFLYEQIADVVIRI